jgi:hypothetical protein
MDRKLIVAAVLIAAVACATSVTHSGGRARDVEAMAVATAASTPAVRSSGSISAPTTQQQRARALDASSEGVFRQHVERKYRYLLADVDEAHVDELKRRLVERESQLTERDREHMDAAIGELLPGHSFAYYGALKDSDREQHHLDEYAGGIDNIAPLDERQQRAVLDAKLRQKKRYDAIMRDIGLQQEALSTTERDYAHERGAQALELYLDEFLLDVAPWLTSEQYTLLKNYETTEFARELSRLQQRINAK